MMITSCRSYGKPFVDLYMRILKAAYDKNDDEILKYGSIDYRFFIMITIVLIIRI